MEQKFIAAWAKAREEAAKRLDLSLEALATGKQFTALFTDEEANNALMRLLTAGFYR